MKLILKFEIYFSGSVYNLLIEKGVTVVTATCESKMHRK